MPWKSHWSEQSSPSLPSFPGLVRRCRRVTWEWDRRDWWERRSSRWVPQSWFPPRLRRSSWMRRSVSPQKHFLCLQSYRCRTRRLVWSHCSSGQPPVYRHLFFWSRTHFFCKPVRGMIIGKNMKRWKPWAASRGRRRNSWPSRNPTQAPVGGFQGSIQSGLSRRIQVSL